MSYTELRHYKMSPGDLYWKNSSGHFVLLRYRGDWLDFNYIEKFERRKIELFVTKIIDIEKLANFQELTQNLIRTKTLKEKEAAWKLWLDYTYARFWNSSDQDRAFELKIMFHSMFYQLEDNYTVKCLAKDMEIFDRFLQVASDVVFLMLILGYTDETLLKELYAATVKSFAVFDSMKLSLTVKENFSSYLRGENVEQEKFGIHQFLDHIADPREKYWTAILFEDLKGENGPIKVFDNEIGDIERILIFANRTRALMGSDKEIFVFEYIRNNFKRFMSPHLKKKIRFYVREMTPVAA